jgi:hypothetical protein
LFLFGMVSAVLNELLHANVIASCSLSTASSISRVSFDFVAISLSRLGRSFTFAFGILLKLILSSFFFFFF